MAADEDDDYMGDLERFIPKEDLLPVKVIFLPLSILHSILRPKIHNQGKKYYSSIRDAMFDLHLSQCFAKPTSRLN